MWLYSIFHKFYPLEQNILDAIIENSPDLLKPLLAAQIKEVNLVQRHTESKEVNLYSIKNKKVFKNPSIRMPIDIEEYNYASLVIQLDNEVFRINAWVVNGYLFSLTFNRTPNKYLKKFNPTKLEVTVNYPVPYRTSSITEEISARSDKVLKSHLHPMETTFPNDYLNSLSASNETVVRNWKVSSMDKIKHIVLPQGNYYVLAESDNDQYLMVKERSQDGKLFLSSHDSEDIIDVGYSLYVAINTIDKGL
ncbi:MAG: hypothetical protein ABFD91_03210 [Anaerohalosphaeraceae bacterium]